MAALFFHARNDGNFRAARVLSTWVIEFCAFLIANPARLPNFGILCTVFHQYILRSVTKAAPRDPNPYPFICQFWQKRKPFRIPSIKKWYLFPIINYGRVTTPLFLFFVYFCLQWIDCSLILVKIFWEPLFYTKVTAFLTFCTLQVEKPQPFHFPTCTAWKW